MKKKIFNLYEEFSKLTNTSQLRRTEKWKENTLMSFINKINCCLDISCSDIEALKKLEKQHGVKMSIHENEFLKDQLGERKMICTTEVDR